MRRAGDWAVVTLWAIMQFLVIVRSQISRQPRAALDGVGHKGRAALQGAEPLGVVLGGARPDKKILLQKRKTGGGTRLPLHPRGWIRWPFHLLALSSLF